MLKPYIRSLVQAAPGGRALWSALNRAAGRSVKFSGWGMITNTLPPWHGEDNDISKDFLTTNRSISRLVKAGDFKVDQFQGIADIDRLLGELMWRHYVVFWSALYASKANNYGSNNLVECGVCDGLTSFFALQSMKGNLASRAYLYDAWEAMKKERLLVSELKNAGSYDFLSVENTKANLKSFEGRLVFNKGVIPESFERSDNPIHLSWLHIDLNSVNATRGALEFFFERILPGGVILFDDYGWPDYIDTKLFVDKFFSGKRGSLLPMPTGQAMYFKN